MKRGIVIAVAAVAAFGAAAGGGYLYARHQCWFCDGPQLFDWGVKRLCSDKEGMRHRGLEGVFKAADSGDARALALSGEVFMDKLPFGFQSFAPEQSSCARKFSTPDRTRGLGYFRQLLDGRSLPPMVSYNLGILVKTGMLSHPQGSGQSLEYFRSAAEQGVGAGLYQLGLDDHRHERFSEAAALFRKTWEQHSNPDAALMLGDYDYRGQMGQPDLTSAAGWYQKALSVIPETNQALRFKAENRLALVEQKLAEAEAAPLVLSYRLEGNSDTYVIYLAEASGTETPIGTVSREGDRIRASIAAQPPVQEAAVSEFPPSGGQAGKPAVEEAAAGDSPAEPQLMEVDSMNQGLMMVLEGYARQRFGTTRPFRFVPAAP